MWLLIIGPIRAYSSALIATNVGFFSIPILAFIGHLTVGDIWNVSRSQSIDRLYRFAKKKTHNTFLSPDNQQH